MRTLLLTTAILFGFISSSNAQMLYHQQFVSGHSLGSGASNGNIDVEETTCGELKVKDGAGTDAQAGIFMTLRDSLSTSAVTVDMSSQTTIYVRARGKAGMNIGVRTRSGSTNSSATVEQALTTDWEWEVLTFDMSSSITPADPANISILWIYFDKGTDGFLGDSAYLDYVTIGEIPDASNNAYCKTDIEDPTSGVNLFHDNLDDDQDTLLSGSALDKVSMDEQQICGQMILKELDPLGDPVGDFGQLLVFLDGGNGVDLTGNAFVTIRAKVVATSDLDIRIDMRDVANNPSNGSSGRITHTWPANEWHTATYAFHPWNLMASGDIPVDVTDIKAFNLYFDTSTDEIDADSIIFDYVSVGGVGSLTETGCGAIAPTISSFTPTSAMEGASVVISGANFTGATDVSFNGVSAVYTVDNDGQITATVPTGDVTGTITVTTSDGTGTSSGTFTLTPAAIGGLSSAGLKVYPSPASGSVNVQLVEGGSFDISISDVTGNQVVAASGSDSISLNVSSLPSGLYIVSVSSESGLQTKRLIIE